jgi:hypothetical protein
VAFAVGVIVNGLRPTVVVPPPPAEAIQVKVVAPLAVKFMGMPEHTTVPGVEGWMKAEVGQNTVGTGEA